MLDVYGAREDPVPGVTGELVSGAFADPSHVHYVADWQEAADYTAAVAQDGDYVITLGCGNVYQIIPQVLEALAQHLAPEAGGVGPDAPAFAAASARRGARDCGCRPARSGISGAAGGPGARRGRRRPATLTTGSVRADGAGHPDHVADAAAAALGAADRTRHARAR